jgi:thiol-disulfide isomerase/thioredoxin
VSVTRSSGLRLLLAGVLASGAGCSSAPAGGPANIATSKGSGDSKGIVHGSVPSSTDSVSTAAAADAGSTASAGSDTSAGGELLAVQPVDYDGYLAAVMKHRGRVVVVDLWATWCAPCVKNFPHLVELHKKYGDKGVACVSFSLDYLGEDEETTVEKKTPSVREFLTKREATFDNLISTLPFDEIASADKLAVSQIPAVICFDKRGKQVRVFTPGPDLPTAKMYEQVETLVGELMADGEGTN